MKLSELIFENEFYSDADIGEIEVGSVTSDTSAVGRETAFVLLPGVRFDTGKIVSFVVAKRPKVIICESLPEDAAEDIPVLFVKNARRTLSFMLSRFWGIDYGKMTFVGITGTNGKSSTAVMLVAALRAAGHKVGLFGTGKIETDGVRLTPETYSMTTPDPSLLYPMLRKMQDAECDMIVMEVSSHALALEKVAPIPFSYALFTNLSPEHLDFHKSMEEYAAAKARLFSMAEVRIFNIDDAYAEEMIRLAPCRVLRVGALERGEICATEIEDHGLDGVSYLYRTGNLSFLVKLSVPGVYNVYNSMLALTAAIALGVKPCIAKRAICDLPGIEGRMETVRADGITVVIDYAHTEEALRCALRTARKSTAGRLFVLFGCGGERDRTKRPKMAATAESIADEVIVTSDNQRREDAASILRDILGGFRKENHRVI
ncbi:MAG TPA: hypothetical protein DDY70_04835, partial [Clostridiales bacterium]|nr:hypothetical protein [Clostridiales bacterium]